MVNKLIYSIPIFILLGILLKKPKKGTIPIQVTNTTKPSPTTNVTPIIKINNTVETEIINEDPMPISEYERPYEISKEFRFWHAIDSPSYIDPNHEVVQWFNRHTEMIEGVLTYDKTEFRLTSKYDTDFDLFDKKDHWINADYYLSHGLNGDCEDFAIALASILETKKIPNMIVAGFAKNNIGHWLLEYHIDNEYRVADTMVSLYGYRKNIKPEWWKPKFMFNKNTEFQLYNPDWV